MQTKQTLRIALSSPSDVDDECRVMDSVIAELNRGVAHERHAVLELAHWKTDAYPGFHQERPVTCSNLFFPNLRKSCGDQIGKFETRI